MVLLLWGVRIAGFALLVYIVWRVLAPALGLPQRLRVDYKCSTCRHASKVYDDGALCRFDNRETYKTTVHIANCLDFEDDPRILGRR